MHNRDINGRVVKWSVDLGECEIKSRFISKLGEKGLPFFKLLKKADDFQWSPEASQALADLKTYLTTSPILTGP